MVSQGNIILSESAEYVNKMEILRSAYKSIHEGNGNLSLYVTTEDGNYKIDLNDDEAKNAISAIYDCFKGMLRDKKREMEKLYISQISMHID